MSRALRVLATLAFVSQIWPEGSGSTLAPSYSSAGIVNSASNQAPLSPNSIASLYGINLAYDTASVSQSDIGSGALPTVLAGVAVFVAGLPAPLYYVSPLQINFLIPANLRTGDVTVFVARQGTRGPFATITLLDTSPGLYQVDADIIVATHADGSRVTHTAPAAGGEVVWFYCTGLGPTDPDVISGQISPVQAPIKMLADLRVTVGAATIAPGQIFYAGVAPGFPGLYLIQAQLPDSMPVDPAVQVALGAQISPPALKMPAK
jgi:uncharacterized protein (TIGR03437 family)